MATGDKRINIYQKKFLPQQHMADNFMEYLRTLVKDTRKRVFPQSGLFSPVALTSTAADTFNMATPVAGMDNAGQEMTCPAGVALTSQVPFENSLAVQYSVGMRYNDNKPSAVETNVRTGTAEYSFKEDVVGEVREPDSVTIITTPTLKLKIVVDTPLRCAASPIKHAGRKATVWLKNVVSKVAAVAIFDATVLWDGAHNYIEVPYTTTQGPLGQTSPTYPISTLTTDYYVHINGVTVTRRAALDLYAQPEYAFIGYITGTGSPSIPTSFDITLQNILALAFGAFTLDGGYDGAAGGGSGRKITVDGGAVELNTGAGGPGDMFNAYLRVINDDRYYDVGFDAIEPESLLSPDRFASASMVVRRKWRGNVSGTSPEFVQTGTCTMVNGTNNITMPAGTYTRLYPGISTITIQSSPGLLDDGTYVVRSVSGNTVTVSRTDATSPTFHTGSATFFLHIIGVTLGGAPINYRSGTAYHDWAGLGIIHDPVANGVPALRVMRVEDMASSALAIEVNRQALAPGVTPGFYARYNGGIYWGGNVENNIIPSTNGDKDIGDQAGNRWNRVVAQALYCTNYLFMEGSAKVDGDLISHTDNAHDLGAPLGSGNRWRNLYIMGITASGNIVPTGDNSQYLGDSSHRWANAFLNAITPASYLLYVNGTIRPMNDNATDLGQTDYRWRDIYGYSLYLKKTATFDGHGTNYTNAWYSPAVGMESLPSMNNSFGLCQVTVPYYTACTAASMVMMGYCTNDPGSGGILPRDAVCTVNGSSNTISLTEAGVNLISAGITVGMVCRLAGHPTAEMNGYYRVVLVQTSSVWIAGIGTGPVTFPGTQAGCTIRFYSGNLLGCFGRQGSHSQILTHSPQGIDPMIIWSHKTSGPDVLNVITTAAATTTNQAGLDSAFTWYGGFRLVSGQGVKSDWSPDYTANNRYLGDGTRWWYRLYAQGVIAGGSGISTDGHIKPASDNSYDLGASGTLQRWRNIYTLDLNLEGGVTSSYFRPDSDGGSNLGHPSFKWWWIYTNMIQTSYIEQYPVDNVNQVVSVSRNLSSTGVNYYDLYQFQPYLNNPFWGVNIGWDGTNYYPIDSNIYSSFAFILGHTFAEFRNLDSGWAGSYGALPGNDERLSIDPSKDNSGTTVWRGSNGWVSQNCIERGKWNMEVTAPSIGGSYSKYWGYSLNFHSYIYPTPSTFTYTDEDHDGTYHGTAVSEIWSCGVRMTHFWNGAGVQQYAVGRYSVP